MDIKILVASHKEYRMPADEIYLPIYVGAGAGIANDKAEALKALGYIPDDSGDNISDKNKNYCELTALYWAWKNLDADYIGLVHYRRHFTLKKYAICDKWERVLKRSEIEELLERSEIILPKKRRYLIETNYSHYAHAHHEEDLTLTRQIISEIYPKYVKAFDGSMARRSGHRFNMLIMKREILDSYCTWLFDILFELEKRLDISAYNDNDARVFGFVSERLMDTWLYANGLGYKEIPHLFMEDQNWLKKGGAFLRRKLKGRH